jgi:hypothetical protein
VPVPALRVEIVAQARHYSRAVPGTGTILTGPGRAWTVLFRAVPRPAHRVSAKWPSIVVKVTTLSLPTGGNKGAGVSIDEIAAIYIYICPHPTPVMSASDLIRGEVLW